MNTVAVEFESSIIHRLVDPGNPTLSLDAARAILELNFPANDRQRMHDLAAKAREGTLSEDEKTETESYERIGSMLALLQSKARISLMKHSASDGDS